jgi:UDPglucose--hexose-1-phosphate uridylyltransferase
VKKTSIRLADGRELIYYDSRDDAVRDAVDSRPLDAVATTAEIRYDALLGDSVAIASHRQARTYHPPADECPLCPSRDGRLGGTSHAGGHGGEIPAADYDVAVFENRFPSLAGDAGRCEVVCFTSDHDASFADLTEEQAGLVLEAWTDRTAELAELPQVEQVFCFENRGAEIGVTLGHPHGQIYGYPFVTPRTELMLRSLAAHHEKTGRNLFDDVVAREREEGTRVVLEASTGSPSCRTRRTGRTRCTSTPSGGCRTCGRSTTRRAPSSRGSIWSCSGASTGSSAPANRPLPTSPPGTRRRSGPRGGTPSVSISSFSPSAALPAS